VIDLSCSRGPQALANFCNALLSSKAHWYQIIAPSSDEPQHVLLRSIFPPLSDPFSLNDKHTFEILVMLGLVWCKKGNYSPLVKEWENFIKGFQLHAGMTTFSISNKQQRYTHLGSWKEMIHLHAMPATIWKKACQQGTYPLPKL